MANRSRVWSGSETAENKVLNLAKALVLYCKSHNERISQKAAQFTVRILLLNPKWNHLLNNDISKSERQSFFHAAFSFLFDEKCLSGLTIRMQCFYYGRYLSREAFKEHQKQVVLRNCFHLLQKLKKVWHNATEDFREMHNDLVQLILIKQGMEYENDHTAFDEMKTAVNSVFPPSSLSTFVLSSQKAKMAFINEVSSVAAGIRIHAWAKKKAGGNMLDVGKIMIETLPRVTEDLYEELNNAKMKIEVLEEMLKDQVHKDSNEDPETYHQKLFLIYFINYLNFVKTLKENIEEIAVNTYKLDYTFTMQIKELNSVVNTCPFGRSEKIYPTYKELAKTWKQMQLEGHLLNFYINIFYDLKKFAERMNEIEINEVPETLETKDKDYLEDTEEKIIKIEPEDVKNYNEITLEFNGFCAFYCSIGVLLPCNKDLGILKYKNSCYGFSSKIAMEQFEKHPEKYIAQAIGYMCIIPQLILTCHMERHFSLHQIFQNSTKMKPVPPVFAKDIDVQTVIHPMEKKWDYTYNWNQWDLRKQALKYVDLETKKTHSTQTNLSHFRRENFSQVYIPRENFAQTRKDASTTVSKGDILSMFSSTSRFHLPEK